MPANTALYNAAATITAYLDAATTTAAAEQTTATERRNTLAQNEFKGLIGLPVTELGDTVFDFTGEGFDIIAHSNSNGQIYIEFSFTPEGGGELVHYIDYQMGGLVRLENNFQAGTISDTPFEAVNTVELILYLNVLFNS